MRQSFAMVLFMALALALTAWLVQVQDYAGFLFYLLAVTAGAWAVYRPGIRSVDREFPFALYLLAFFTKVLASAGRYWMVFSLYEGSGDSRRYHSDAVYIAQSVMEGDFSVFGKLHFGTYGLSHLVGLLYSVFPQSLEGSFLFFSFLAFLGSIFFYRTYCSTFPEGDRRFYRLLIFFLPSILFWPSSVGKDAVVFFGLGLTSWGVVTLWEGKFLQGGAWAAAGLFAAVLVRPYTPAILIMAVGGSYLISSSRGLRYPGRHLVNGLLLFVFGLFVLQKGTEFLLQSGVEEVTWEGIVDFYTTRRFATRGGGAAFVPPFVLNALGVPLAFVAVLFRPFLWEAHNVQSVVASLESLFWLGLLWTRRRVFAGRLRTLRRDPMITLALIFVVLMILVQTTTGNFAIVARQRVQFLPFFFMLFI